MKKRRIVLCVLFIVVGVIIGVFAYSTTGSNEDTDEKNAIKATVEKALRISYGWLSKENSQNIFSNDCKKRLETDGFYNGWSFYTINRDFMDSYRKIDANTVEITVEVYAPDIEFPIFTLTKTKEGEYLITDFGCDT